MIETPLGGVKLTVDDIPVDYKTRVIDNPESIYPSPPPKESCLIYFEYAYDSDKKPHTIEVYLDPNPCEGDHSSDEHQECLLFEKSPWSVCIGVLADIGCGEEYGLDYDGNFNEKEISLYIEPTTKSQAFKFAVSWAREEDGMDVGDWAEMTTDPFTIDCVLNRKES